MRIWNIILNKKALDNAKVIPKKESNLVIHARRELTLLGEEPETINGYLKVIQAFSDMEHSGGSASIAIPTINALLQYKNLKPLTDDPKEWADVADATETAPAIWQNVRNSEAFSNDGGKTYYLLSEVNRRKPKKMHESVPLASLHEL